MNDIVVSSCSLMDARSGIVGLSVFNKFVASVAAIFRGLPLLRDSPAGAFLFDEVSTTLLPVLTRQCTARSR